jgi:fido (protein-threonine AMPylation protein)
MNGSSRTSKPLEESWLRRLHREMFGQSWRWAGQYRNSDKSIGGDWRQIRLQVPALQADSDRHPFPPPARLHPPVPQRQRSSRPLDR